MSKIIKQITISPPEGMFYKSARTESLSSGIYPCNVCNGMGGKYNDQHSIEGEGWAVCPMCEGSCQIQAEITFVWGAIGKPKKQFRKEVNDGTTET